MGGEWVVRFIFHMGMGMGVEKREGDVMRGFENQKEC